jgi:hypothetical protein
MVTGDLIATYQEKSDFKIDLGLTAIIKTQIAPNAESLSTLVMRVL